MQIDTPRDTEGYLFHPEDWDEAIATAIAREEGIELNEAYWTALYFIRDSFQENDIAPDVRHLVSYLADKNGWTKKAAKQHVFELFPYGYVKQACKIAGMKKPRAWSTG